MSLTTHLSDKNSPIKNLFDIHFKNLDILLKEENKKIKDSTIILPENEKKYEWTKVGHIVEYLLALHLGLKIDKLYPMQIMAYVDTTNFKKLQSFVEGVEMSNLNSVQLMDLIKKMLYPLACYEGMLRKSNETSFNPFHNRKITGEMLKDIVNIFENSILKNSLFSDNNNLFAYNPQFNPLLTKMIGGADGDLIQINKNGNFLIDLKTTKFNKLTKQMLYQLLGYLALDQTDSYHLRSIGIYLTRQNIVLKYSVDSLIKNYSNFEDITNFRKEFRKVIVNEKQHD